MSSKLLALPGPATRLAKRKAKTRIVCEYRGREQRLVKKTFPTGHVFHYTGSKGQERRTRAELPCGNVHHLEGHKGRERLVRTEDRAGTGNVYHYSVIDGRNAWERCELPNGAVEHFRRIKNRSKMGVVIARSHFVHPDGCVTHYAGERLYHERRVRYEVPPEATTRPGDWPHGYVLHYEGESHGERLVCKEVPERSGTTMWYFDGDPGEEYETNVDWADGRKSIIGFHGELETTTYPNGKMAHYSPGGHAGSHVHGPVSLWSVEHLDGTQDFFHDHAQDDTDDEDASWNVREDCISKERLSERVYPNGDRHYFCPYNDNRTTQIHRAVGGHLVPVRPAQVLWYRVREWFKRRTIVLHWQEQTQMRLYGPSGTGRLADHAAFVSEFVN